MGQRENNKTQTRLRLADAAIEAFVERGYDNVTMAEVAAAAGVSRRTAFRYFPTKDGLVMQHPAEWLVVFDQSVAASEDQLLENRLGAACLAVAAHIEADPAAVRKLFGLAEAHQSLAASYAASSVQWTDRIAAEIRAAGRSEAESLMLAAAIMGVVNAACQIWARGSQPLGALIEQGLGLVVW